MNNQLELFSKPTSTLNVSATYRMAELAELDIRMKKLHPNAVLPQYAKDGDAGMDLVATEILNETDTQISYGIGIAVEIPRGYVGLIFPRSSVRKTGLQLSNSVGVIDCVPAGTMIRMSDNTLIDVKDIFESGGKLNNIKSFNVETNEFESDYIDEMWLVDGVNLVEIEDEDGNIIRLPETKRIYTSNGWKQVKELDDTDLLLKYE